MSSGNGPDSSAEAALDWLMRVREAPQDAHLLRDLEAWLDADSSNRRAWDKAGRAWRAMGEIPLPVYRTAQRHLPAPAVAGLSPGSGRRRRRALPAVAAALAACLALVVGTVSLRQNGADHATATAELQNLALADGTAIQLGPESTLRTGFTAGRREVDLLGGEAFFEVTPDPGRPFVVRAGGLSVTVTGTAFEVRDLPRGRSVAVESGEVQVRIDDLAGAVHMQLGPGERVKVDSATGAVVRDRLAPGDIAVWREGRLFVADLAIADVVADLRRYQDGWIVIADDRLARLRVTGIYDLNDPRRALRAVLRPTGGRVREVTPYLQVLDLP